MAHIDCRVDPCSMKSMIDRVLAMVEKLQHLCIGAKQQPIGCFAPHAVLFFNYAAKSNIQNH